MTQWSNGKRWRTSLVFGLIIFLPGILHAWDEETFFQQKRLSAHAFVLPRIPSDWRAQTVIGSPTEYVVQEKDTTLDIARALGLGYNEMSGAFPGVDPWLPPIGQVLNLPTFWILPKSDYQGVVVNIPEMRLYYFPPLQQGLSNRSVITLPAGLGREDWPTPKAKFTIRGKTANPVWVIPDSIKKERIQDKGWTEDSIAGGSPDNPLGKYRIELTLPLYAIHDTNNPWAIGRLTTHGCIRLYPEDIAQFFDLIRIGVPGEFVYQPVKIGVLYGKVYAEVHDDIYNLIPDLWAEAQRVVQESGWEDRIDRTLLTKVLMAKTGVPTDVTKGSQLVEMAGVVPKPNYDFEEARRSEPPTQNIPETVVMKTPEILSESSPLPNREEEDEREAREPNPLRESDTTRVREVREESLPPAPPNRGSEEERELSPAIGLNDTRERVLETQPPGEDTEAVVDSAIDRVESSFLESERRMREALKPRPPVDSAVQPNTEAKAKIAQPEQLPLRETLGQTGTRPSPETASVQETMRPRETPTQVREPYGRTERRARRDSSSAKHVRVRQVKPNMLKFRSYFDTLSDWESGVKNGIQNPHRQEIRNP